MERQEETGKWKLRRVGKLETGEDGKNTIIAINKSNGLNYTNLNSTSSNKSIKYIHVVTLLLCICLSVVVNFLFIAIFARNIVFYRRSVFCITLNLVFICIVDTLYFQIFTIISVIDEGLLKNLHESICISLAFSSNLCDCCISLTLLLLSVDRVVAVRANLAGNSRLARGLPRQSVTLCLLCLWLLAICVSVPLLTNTIPSFFWSPVFCCVPKFADNTAYSYCLICISLGVPLLCSIGSHIFVLHAWRQEHRLMQASRFHIPGIQLQIRKEVRHSLFSFIVIVVWIVLCAPHFLTLFFNQLFANDVTTTFYWMRNFFSLAPFLLCLCFHRSFQRGLLLVLCGGSKLSVRRGPSDCQMSVSQQNTSSTNVTGPRTTPAALVAAHRDIDPQGSFYSGGASSSNGHSFYSTPSLSRSSSGVGRVLPKMPVLFATEAGVHIDYSVQRRPSGYGRTDSAESGTTIGAGGGRVGFLCDVNEASFTDISESVCTTPRQSIHSGANNNSNLTAAVKLPADIISFYNPEDLKVKRSRSKSNVQSSVIRNNLESAFHAPDLSQGFINHACVFPLPDRPKDEKNDLRVTLDQRVYEKSPSDPHFAPTLILATTEQPAMFREPGKASCKSLDNLDPYLDPPGSSKA